MIDKCPICEEQTYSLPLAATELRGSNRSYMPLEIACMTQPYSIEILRFWPTIGFNLF